MEWDRISFKTPEKIKKYAEMNGMTLQELDDFRKATGWRPKVDLAEVIKRTIASFLVEGTA